ncbi:MAG: hypothetical protein JWM14_697 [Chitinophagaceae bacterium]|nr:hypothetical protein [Chitinophagaceae bacterium]
MRKILAGLCLLCGVITSLSAQTFEGSFVMHVQDDHSVNMMSVSVRKDKLILQPLDPTIPKPVKILMSKNSNDIFVLTEEGGMKVAIKYTFENPPVPAVVAPVDTIPSEISVKETGNTKTLEGFVCKEVFINDLSGMKLQLWVTPDLGFTMAQFSEYLGKFSAALNGGDYAQTVKFNSTAIYKKNMALEVKEVKETDATVILIKKIVKAVLPESDFTTDGYMVVDIKDIPGAE